MQTVYKCNGYNYKCKQFTNVNTQQGAGAATEQGQDRAQPRQCVGGRERATVPALREGCERNERCGSFAGVSEPSRQAQLALCPISARRGGGGL